MSTHRTASWGHQPSSPLTLSNTLRNMDKKPGSDGRKLLRRASELNQERVETEMRVVEVELAEQYSSHQRFLQTLASASPSESQLLKAQLDRLYQRNSQRTQQLGLLQGHYEEICQAQRDVIPISQRLRPTTSESALSIGSGRVVTDIDFIPALLGRKAELEQQAETVEQNCEFCEAESLRIQQMLGKEKQATVRTKQLILRERMQQVKDIHRRFMKKYDSVLQTRFVARNHLVLAENEVIKQKVINEELRRRFKDSMEQQRVVKQATLQHISEAVEKLSLKSLRLKSKRRANAALLEAAQQGLEEFTSARISLEMYENQLASYRSSFATIAQYFPPRVIEERTGIVLQSEASSEVVQDILRAFKTYASQEATLSRYYQDLTLERDFKCRQCELLKEEMAQLAASKEFLQDRDSHISVNLLRMSVEDKQELDAEAKHTSKTERTAIDVYLNVVEHSESVLTAFKIIVENAPKLAPELRQLLTALETADLEYGRGFTGKHEAKFSQNRTPRSGTHRQSDIFPTEIDAERNHFPGKTQFSLSTREMAESYLRVFPGKSIEAEDFAETAHSSPVVHFCLSAKSLELYLKQFSGPQALNSAKTQLPQLLVQAHATLVTNVREMTKGLLPFLESLRDQVGREYEQLIHTAKTQAPSRLAEAEGCLDPNFKSKRTAKYTNQQKEILSRKIGSLLSNQRGAEDFFVMENRYIVEENVLKPKVRKGEGETGEEEFVQQSRIGYRLSKTAQGMRKDHIDTSSSAILPEKKSLSKSLLLGIRSIENRLTLLKVREKSVQETYAQLKGEMPKESPRFLAPLQTSPSLSRLESRSTRPYTQSSGRRTNTAKYKVRIGGLKP